MPSGGVIIRAGSRASANSNSNSNSNDMQSIIDYQTLMNEFALSSAKQQQEAQAEADRIAMNFSAEEAQKLRDWETEMSNTAYQRAVSDMRAAGINPILAASNGGASTPAGSAGSGVSSSRQAAQLNLDNVVYSFKSLIRQLDQSAANAQTAAQAQKYSATVTAASNLISSALPFVAVRKKAR